MTPDMKAEILRLLHKGVSSGDIAAAVGCTRNMVCGVRERAGGSAAFGRPIKKRTPMRACAPAPAFKADSTATCQWLTGEARKRQFCGAPAKSHRQPWCEDHYPKVYIVRLDKPPAEVMSV